MRCKLGIMTYFSALPDQASHVVRSWVLPLWMDMLVQIIDRPSVRVDDVLHILRTHSALHPSARTRNQSLSFELVCV
jgi:hypothetical protein